MIANAYLNEWRQIVPWSDNKMVEQDLVISCLLVELFKHPKISDSLAIFLTYGLLCNKKAAVDVFEKIILLIPIKQWKSNKENRQSK